MAKSPIRVGAIDDHPTILAGVAAGLSDTTQLSDGRPLEFGPMATTVAEFLELDAPCDVVLLDIALGDSSDVAANVTALMSLGSAVILFTQERRSGPVARGLRAGALGVVGKHESMSVVADAIAIAAAGEAILNPDWAAIVGAGSVPDLAPRETETLTLYAAGLPLKTVARRMGISEVTAKEYLIRARRKYAEVGRPAATKTDLFVRAVEDGYLDSP